MSFRNVTTFGEKTERTQIRENIIWLLRDSLLNIGGYYNIPSGTFGTDDSDWSFLRPSHQTEHSDFQFWKGYTHQWVWESGLNPSYTGGSAPLQPSGVFVNGTFYPSATTTGIYSNYIDYNRGGVVFTGALPSGTQVICEHSQRAAFVYSTESTEYRNILDQNRRFFNAPPGSGYDIYAPEYSAYMPCIFVGVTKSASVPYEIGSRAQWKTFKVEFDIFAENQHDFDKLKDLCTSLESLTMQMFDTNNIPYPLNYKGILRDEAKTRSFLINNYAWYKGQFADNAADRNFAPILPVKRGTVTIDFELAI